MPIRRTLTQSVQKLPPPVRDAIWTERRTAARLGRRLRERRGDFSRSHPAAYRIDYELDHLFGGERGGFFVEAGALDGFYESNTYFLERARGWTGILVEPTPIYARSARRERPSSRVVQCALVPADYPSDVVELRFGGSKTVVESGDARDWVADAQEHIALDAPEHVYRAPARTLSDVLTAEGAPQIDLLSLDVEGYEPQVLAGLDLGVHAPRYVVIEVDMVTPRAEVERYLLPRYRPVKQLSPHDVLYESVCAS
jgi:FkbM family methyltransferase